MPVNAKPQALPFRAAASFQYQINTTLGIILIISKTINGMQTIAQKCLGLMAFLASIACGSQCLGADWIGVKTQDFIVGLFDALRFARQLINERGATDMT